MKWILTFAVALIVLTACTATQTQPTPTLSEVEGPVSTDTSMANMPNLASVYCAEQGFKSEIRTATNGSQSGVCIFPDGSECDEWAYYRDECGPSSQVTGTPAVVPTSPVYSPELVTPDPSLYAGWIEYADSNYRYKFRYPPEWTAELDLRADSTTYQHFIWLRAPSKPVAGVEMHIAFERINENFGLQRTGIGAGDLIGRGNVLFLDEPTKRIVLSLEGIDMEVMYSTTGAFERGTMRFAISLYYAGTERLGLTPELQQIADLIVASFELIQQ